jgi:hypothetical protein
MQALRDLQRLAEALVRVDDVDAALPGAACVCERTVITLCAPQ